MTNLIEKWRFYRPPNMLAVKHSARSTKNDLEQVDIRVGSEKTINHRSFISNPNNRSCESIDSREVALDLWLLHTDI